MRRKQKQPRQPRRAFSNKLRIISTVLIVSLMFSGCSLLVRSGAAYVDGKTYRNAIQQLDGTDYASNYVCQVFQKGYMLGDKLVRPAMVAVAV